MFKKGFSLASGRYTVFVLPQNRQPGVGTRVTQWRHQTRHASFCVYASVHPLSGQRFFRRCAVCVMVARAGQPSGWPVSIEAGIPTPSGLPPMSVGTPVVAATATQWRLSS